jgi:hypothetical protein
MRFKPRKIFLLIIAISILVSTGLSQNLEIFKNSNSYNEARGDRKYPEPFFQLKNGVYPNNGLATAVYNIPGKKYQLQINVNPEYNDNLDKSFKKARRVAEFYIKIIKLYAKNASVEALNNHLKNADKEGDMVINWGDSDKFVEKLMDEYDVSKNLKGKELLKSLQQKMGD